MWFRVLFCAAMVCALALVLWGFGPAVQSMWAWAWRRLLIWCYGEARPNVQLYPLDEGARIGFRVVIPNKRRLPLKRCVLIWQTGPGWDKYVTSADVPVGSEAEYDEEVRWRPFDGPEPNRTLPWSIYVALDLEQGAAVDHQTGFVYRFDSKGKVQP